MSIGTVIKIAKAGCVAATVVLPAVEAATVVAKGTAKFIKNKMDNSEKIQEIKKVRDALNGNWLRRNY